VILQLVYGTVTMNPLKFLSEVEDKNSGPCTWQILLLYFRVGTGQD